MKHSFSIAISAALTSIGAPAIAQQSAWHSSFGQGNQEYLTGEWDAPRGGALLLNCNTLDGTASLSAQIAGQGPPASSGINLDVSHRGSTRSIRLATNQKGTVSFGRALSSPVLSNIWSMLRAGDTVTIRYADGRSTIQSLVGAARTLPPKPCG